MHVIKVDGAGPGEPAVRLVDDDGQPVAEVAAGGRVLRVKTVEALPGADRIISLLGELGDSRDQPEDAS